MGVAQSLVRAGIATRGSDLNPAALQRFSDAGGYPAKSLKDAVTGCTIVILMLVNADQCDSVLFGAGGIVEEVAEGTVVLLGSTTSARYAKQLDHRLQAQGLILIDAPVSGGAVKAMSGELSIMASGAPQAFERCTAIFDAIAAKLYRVGDEVGGGASVKMINQLLAGVHIAAAAEAMALGIRAGPDPELLYDIISNSAGTSRMFQNRVPHILAGDYSTKSSVDIFVKALGIVTDAGKEIKFSPPERRSSFCQPVLQVMAKRMIRR